MENSENSENSKNSKSNCPPSLSVDNWVDILLFLRIPKDFKNVAQVCTETASAARILKLSKAIEWSQPQITNNNSKRTRYFILPNQCLHGKYEQYWRGQMPDEWIHSWSEYAFGSMVKNSSSWIAVDEKDLPQWVNDSNNDWVQCRNQNQFRLGQNAYRFI